MFNLGRVSVDIGKAFKDFGTSIGSSAKSLVTRFGSLLAGGGGKLAEVDYSVTEAKWGEQGVEWEKAIEERFNKTKDVAEREAAYRELMEAKVQANVEALSQQREAVLSALTERIKAQYDTLAEAGKAAPEELINELARANEWVKSNISWGTEITQEMIDEFDAGGTMAGRAWAVAVDNAISAYDLTTPEGFKQLIEDVGDSQIAFELGVAALRKWEEESQALEKDIESLNSQITELTTEITALESKLNKLSQVLTNVSSAFDLAIAINELELVSDKAQGLEIDIANLNAALSRSEMEMLPLQRALEGVEKEFDAIQDAIDKTQQKLDDFMNAPVEGEGAYREQRYQLERQIAQKEHALEAAQRGLQPFEDAGLTGSDTYKAAAVAVTALEAEIAKLQNQLDDLDYARENITSPVEHAKEMAELAQQGAEQSAQAIIDGIKLESDKLALLQKQSDEKQKELDLAQGLVDKKQAEIDKTTKAIEQKTAELKVIQDQVAASNALVEAAKKRAEAEANIKDLKSKVLELDTSVLGVEGLISAQKLVQNAQDYAAGLLSKEQLEAMVAMYNTVAGQISDITGQKTLKEFDVVDLTEKLSGKTGEQATLAQKIADLTTTLQGMIGGINPEALSKQDLEDLFGANVGSLIRYMNANISQIKVNTAKLAGIEGYAKGGIEMASQKLTMLHGPEAVIPLQNGSIPVTLYGAGTQSGGETVVNNTTVEIGSIVVRDNEDLEEVKGAILALRQGQVNFFSRAAQYPERF
jgi:predicted  nucleic acid-binding Zn-ribbon protein